MGPLSGDHVTTMESRLPCASTTIWPAGNKAQAFRKLRYRFLLPASDKPSVGSTVDLPVATGHSQSLKEEKICMILCNREEYTASQLCSAKILYDEAFCKFDLFVRGKRLYISYLTKYEGLKDVKRKCCSR